MHISDGILSTHFLIIGWTLSIMILYYLHYRYSYLKNEYLELIPKISVLTATFFVVSFIYIPIGFTSIHLMLIGPISIILGPYSYVCIFVSLILQSIFLHCGGILSLGVNSFIMGSGSLFNYYLYEYFKNYTSYSRAGSLSTFLSLFYSTLLLYLVLYLNGNLINLSFQYFIQFHAIPMILTIVIESIITSFVLHFLKKVKPELIKEK